jgi:hypothetical protein
MAMKCVCMVDALYEYKRLFGKCYGRDILSYLGIDCEIPRNIKVNVESFSMDRDNFACICIYAMNSCFP